MDSFIHKFVLCLYAVILNVFMILSCVALYLVETTDVHVRHFLCRAMYMHIALNTLLQMSL